MSNNFSATSMSSRPHRRADLLPGRSQPSIMGPERAAPATFLLAFGRKNKKPGLSPLDCFKLGTERLVSKMLACLPSAFYVWLETANLFEGAGQPPPSLQETVGGVLAAYPGMKDTLVRIREVYFPSGQGVQNRAWYYPAQPGKPTLVNSMGNNSTLKRMMDYVGLMEAGYGVLAYEYPGYGATPGSPTEQVLRASLEGASDFLIRKGVPLSRQVAYGVSLGGGVTGVVAAKRPFGAVILESALPDFEALVRYQMETVYRVPAWLLPLHRQVRSRFDVLSQVSTITAPLLVLHGGADRLIPFDFAQQLYERAGTPGHLKVLKRIAEGRHNLVPQNKLGLLREFLEGLPAETA